MKKLLSLCLSLMLALTLAIPAAAANTLAAGDGVSVQVNGEDVAFPNASPEVANGRTMVPMRAVLEALGADVEYYADSQTVKATLGSTSLHHVIGTNSITVNEEKSNEDSLGTGAVLTMDTTSYVKSGSTLVPLRFFSQALGYEVYWDAGARTAVVIDKAAVAAEIDKSFGILNSLRSKAPAVSGDMAMDMDLSGEIRLLDGTTDEVLPFSAKTSALYGADAMNISGSMDLSAIARLAEIADDPTAAELAPMLSGLSFQMICGESMWMNAPALVNLLPEAAEAEGDVWLKYGDFDMSMLTAASSANISVGSMLYDAMAYMDADMPVNIYDDLTQAAGFLTVLIGDDTFTEDGGNYSWKLDETASAFLAAAIGETPDSFSLTMEMEVNADGSSSFSMDLKAEDTVSMSLSGESTSTSASVKCHLTVPEVCDVTVQCNATMKASGTAPVTAPPDDAVVVDLSGNFLLQ